MRVCNLFLDRQLQRIPRITQVIGNKQMKVNTILNNHVLFEHIFILDDVCKFEEDANALNVLNQFCARVSIHPMTHVLVRITN